MKRLFGLKRHFRIFGEISIFFLFSFHSMLHAGAWTQKKGGYFFKFSNAFHRTGQEFNYLGEAVDIFEDLEVYENTAYQEFKLKIYGEYGLTPHLTLVADLPFKFAVSEQTQISNYFEDGMRDVTFTTVGFGDFSFYTRFGILSGPFVLSFQPGIKLPLGYDTSKDNEGPSLGTGDVDVEGALLWGSSFHPMPFYITGSIGYRHRTGKLHDEYFGTIEAGLTFHKFLFKSEFSLLRNEMAPPDIFGAPLMLPLPGGGGVTPDRLFGDQDFTKLNVEGVYKVKENLGISSELTHILAGKNIITGRTFSLGLTLMR